MEIKSISKEDVVLWSRPKKIKEGWLNAVIEKPIFEGRNIQFIMRCNYNKLSYIVVSRQALSLKEIENIELDDYIFDNQINFSRGVKLGGVS